MGFENFPNKKLYTKTTILSKSTNYTLAVADAGSLILMSAATLTVPDNTSVPIEIGTSITIVQSSTTQVTLTEGSGVTIYATPGKKLRVQWSSATLVKTATNEWLAIGDLSL